MQQSISSSDVSLDTGRLNKALDGIDDDVNDDDDVATKLIKKFEDHNDDDNDEDDTYRGETNNSKRNKFMKVQKVSSKTYDENFQSTIKSGEYQSDVRIDDKEKYFKALEERHMNASPLNFSLLNQQFENTDSTTLNTSNFLDLIEEKQQQQLQRLKQHQKQQPNEKVDNDIETMHINIGDDFTQQKRNDDGDNDDDDEDDDDGKTETMKKNAEHDDLNISGVSTAASETSVSVVSSREMRNKILSDLNKKHKQANDTSAAAVAVTAVTTTVAATIATTTTAVFTATNISSTDEAYLKSNKMNDNKEDDGDDDEDDDGGLSQTVENRYKSNDDDVKDDDVNVAGDTGRKNIINIMKAIKPSPRLSLTRNKLLSGMSVNRENDGYGDDRHNLTTPRFTTTTTSVTSTTAKTGKSVISPSMRTLPTATKSKLSAVKSVTKSKTAATSKSLMTTQTSTKDTKVQSVTAKGLENNKTSPNDSSNNKTTLATKANATTYKVLQPVTLQQQQPSISSNGNEITLKQRRLRDDNKQVDSNNYPDDDDDNKNDDDDYNYDDEKFSDIDDDDDSNLKMAPKESADFEKILKEQERLLRGYQEENEKLYKQLKTFKTERDNKKDELERENLLLKKDLDRLKIQPLNSVASSTKTLKIDKTKQHQIDQQQQQQLLLQQIQQYKNNEKLYQDKIFYLEVELECAKVEKANLKKEMDKLRVRLNGKSKELLDLQTSILHNATNRRSRTHQASSSPPQSHKQRQQQLQPSSSVSPPRANTNNISSSNNDIKLQQLPSSFSQNDNVISYYESKIEMMARESAERERKSEESFKQLYDQHLIIKKQYEEHLKDLEDELEYYRYYPPQPTIATKSSSLPPNPDDGGDDDVYKDDGDHHRDHHHGEQRRLAVDRVKKVENEVESLKREIADYKKLTKQDDKDNISNKKTTVTEKKVIKSATDKKSNDDDDDNFHHHHRRRDDGNDVGGNDNRLQTHLVDDGNDDKKILMGNAEKYRETVVKLSDENNLLKNKLALLSQEHELDMNRMRSTYMTVQLNDKSRIQSLEIAIKNLKDQLSIKVSEVEILSNVQQRNKSLEESLAALKEELVEAKMNHTPKKQYEQLKARVNELSQRLTSREQLLETILKTTNTAQQQPTSNNYSNAVDAANLISQIEETNKWKVVVLEKSREIDYFRQQLDVILEFLRSLKMQGIKLPDNIGGTFPLHNFSTNQSIAKQFSEPNAKVFSQLPYQFSMNQPIT
ncbi:hypothetical protein HELRODRAFT_188452 [Helobdella robusta]|uniref:Centrosomal protein of 162 kDa n=1 Tax=Helobdella robusta TaxID=6412 RepID=T1FQ02_HELRO|nr:hypothetical protein HELRODRAFT_188452 [Helobdella robusta]ESO06690.1 hypothetical protein HELRODRAFT_188452 [Helobdella robusta]